MAPATAVSAVLACALVPPILVGPITGVAADRHDRRPSSASPWPYLVAGPLADLVFKALMLISTAAVSRSRSVAALEPDLELQSELEAIPC